MYTQDDFLESIKSFLSMETSGALMISGAWGCGKTYYIHNTLKENLENSDKLPITISLFGFSTLDNIEKRITETFLQEHGEENLSPADEKDTKAITKISKLLTRAKLSRGTQDIQSIADMLPFIGQFVDVSRIVDAYTTLCTKRLPKDKLVLIFDDLERAVKTIKPHLLLGIINGLVEIKRYKVILIANDSYFSKGSRSYLDFKEKVIERTLLFPPDVVSIYKGLIKGYGSEFATLMSAPRYVSIIDPEVNVNKIGLDLQENLNNIRILKFSVAHFSKIYESLENPVKTYPNNHDLDQFLLSLWALTVGLSIEYKCNRITCLDRNAYIKASAAESFMIDLDDCELNPFVPQEEKENQKEIDDTAERIHDIFKRYIERHGLPLIASVQVFDLITAGINVDAKQLIQSWDEYRLNIERQKENPAAQLISRFVMSIGSFTNEEFPAQLQLLAQYTEQGLLTDDASYINAATFLQHYGILIGKAPEEIKAIITNGIDTHYKRITKIPVLAKTSLEMIGAEVPPISKWVVEYIKAKIENQVDKEMNDDIQEVIRQFQEDLPALAQRLLPDLSSHNVPDFFTFPILDKIPEDVIWAKIRVIQPKEVLTISTILESRFIQRNTDVPYSEESVFVLNLQKSIEARGKSQTLADYLIKDHLLPKIEKLIAAPPQKKNVTVPATPS